MIHLAKANKRQTINQGQFIIESLPLGMPCPITRTMEFISWDDWIMLRYTLVFW